MDIFWNIIIYIGEKINAWAAGQDFPDIIYFINTELHTS